MSYAKRSDNDGLAPVAAVPKLFEHVLPLPTWWSMERPRENRAGRNLSDERRATLDESKQLVRDEIG
jgi:hypothetical protein